MQVGDQMIGELPKTFWETINVRSLEASEESTLGLHPPRQIWVLLTFFLRTKNSPNVVYDCGEFPLESTETWRQ